MAKIWSMQVTLKRKRIGHTDLKDMMDDLAFWTAQRTNHRYMITDVRVVAAEDYGGATPETDQD